MDFPRRTEVSEVQTRLRTTGLYGTLSDVLVPSPHIHPIHLTLSAVHVLFPLQTVGLSCSHFQEEEDLFMLLI